MDFSFFSRSQSSQFSTSIINGKSETVRSRTFTYEFKAVQIGEFEVPPAEVYVDNTSYKTNSVKIKIQEEPVSNAQKKTQKRKRSFFFDSEDDPFSKFFGTQRKNDIPTDQNLEDSFLLDVEVDKDSVYVGEQIIVSWYLYTRHNVTDINTLKYPLLKGFWKEERYSKS